MSAIRTTTVSLANDYEWISVGENWYEFTIRVSENFTFVAGVMFELGRWAPYVYDVDYKFERRTNADAVDTLDQAFESAERLLAKVLTTLVVENATVTPRRVALTEAQKRAY